MSIKLNHTIVPAHDKEAAARFFAQIFGLQYAGPKGHFAPVRVNEELTLDFDNAESFEHHHYAFHVNDRYEDERRPQFQMIADAIPFARDAAIEILDVGAGYGALTQFVLEQFPNATALCQDGSEEMAELGRRRMVKWNGRFDYVIADFSKPGWSRAIHGTFDAVVSTIAIHNVRIPAIIEAIYKEVFQLVKPGGCFLNLDLVFVPLAKQLDWLRAAGFTDVKSYWHEAREALFGGRKIQETVRGKNRPSGRDWRRAVNS